MCLAKDVMTSNPSVAREENTIYEVVRIMSREDCGVVPVVDLDDKCAGIITDRDICMSAGCTRISRKPEAACFPPM